MALMGILHTKITDGFGGIRDMSGWPLSGYRSHVDHEAENEAGMWEARSHSGNGPCP